MVPFVIEGGLHGVGIGVIWIPHYPAAAPTWVTACPVAPKKDSLLCKEVRCVFSCCMCLCEVEFHSSCLILHVFVWRLCEFCSPHRVSGR